MVRGTRRFIEALATDGRVTATAIQTVGVKGYDGFGLILVTAPWRHDEPPVFGAHYA